MQLLTKALTTLAEVLEKEGFMEKNPQWNLLGGYNIVKLNTLGQFKNRQISIRSDWCTYAKKDSVVPWKFLGNCRTEYIFIYSFFINNFFLEFDVCFLWPINSYLLIGTMYFNTWCETIILTFMNWNVSRQQWFVGLAIHVAFLTSMSSYIAYLHNRQ